MKRRTMTQYMFLFLLCIVFCLAGDIMVADAEDEEIPSSVEFYYSTDAADANMLNSVTLKDETTGESYDEPIFHVHDDNNVFYMYLDKGSADSIELLSTENEPSEGENWWEDAKAFRINQWGTEEPIMKSIDEENDFITVESLDGQNGWYKISVKDKVKCNLGLHLEIRTVGTSGYTDEDGQEHFDSWVDGKVVTIIYHEAPLTLVNENDPYDFNRYLDGNPCKPVEFQLQQLKTENGKVTLDKDVSPDDLDLLISSREDGWEDGQEHIEKADPDTYTLTSANGTFSFTSKVEGKYYLVPKGSYTVEDVESTVPTALPENPIQIEMWLPAISFYSASDVTFDSWLGFETTYKEPQTSTIYAAPYFNENDPWAVDPSTIEFMAYSNDGKKLSGYITTTVDAEHPDIYRIDITDKAFGDFTIEATAKYNGYGSPDDPGLSEILTDEIMVKTTLKDIRIKTAPSKTTYTEGEAFDKAGIVVEAVYSDHSSYVVTDYAINAPARFAATDKEVSISWHGKTAKQTVTVNAKTIASQPSATTVPKVKVGDTIIFSGNTYQVIVASSGKKEVAYKKVDQKAKKVTIPSSITINGASYKVTEIAANSFSGNKKISSVTIPASVVKIGDNAFKNCTKLTKLTIPKDVKIIGKNAFSGCKKIKTIIIKSTKLKTIGKNAFKGLDKKTTIKVPKSKKKTYTKLLKKAGFKGKIK